MSKIILFAGAATMFICGIVVEYESYIAMSLGLMWIGLAQKT